MKYLIEQLDKEEAKAELRRKVNQKHRNKQRNGGLRRCQELEM